MNGDWKISRSNAMAIEDAVARSALLGKSADGERIATLRIEKAAACGHHPDGGGRRATIARNSISGQLERLFARGHAASYETVLECQYEGGGQLMDQLGHAIVIGGSIAGLIAARALSDYFQRITILERDEIENRPVIHKSVPQGNHLHALLNGGQRVLSALYPGFTDDLRGLGANRFTIGRDVAWYFPDGKAYSATGSLREPFDVDLEGHCASRGLIEYVIRRRTQELPGLRAETRTTVRELICRDGRVLGVRCDDGRSFEAEIVVDATGRASRAPQWLAAAGVSEPRQTTIGVDTAYSTANFRVPQWYDGESLVFITGPPPTFTRRGYIIRIENGSLLVSLIGRFGDYPPTDREGFLGFAKGAALRSRVENHKRGRAAQPDCASSISH